MEPAATHPPPPQRQTTPAWDDALLEQNPHAIADKRSRVQRMFASIAPSYDLNNRLHSFWQDQRWRRKAVKLAMLKARDRVLDVACGTGDLTLLFARALQRMSSDGITDVLGADFTFEMLPHARSKARAMEDRDQDAQRRDAGRLPKDMQVLWKLTFRSPRWLNADAQSLPLPDACCDVVSIAFGIRNVADPATALREFRRVLRPGGRVIVLEFSQPTNRVLRWLNDVYCCRIMPHTATWISRDRSGAYKYLPTSVRTFLDREQMTQMIRDAGFDDVQQFPMTFGVCVCYRGFVRG
jgi:demethylmenaquinone methyltransferase/2-methoxy-6-polyprenyl-1,4-benzoquinol methylase